jgi:hypothetical protein
MGCCKQSNEPSGSIKCREVLDYLSRLLASQERLLYGVSRLVGQSVKGLKHSLYSSKVSSCDDALPVSCMCPALGINKMSKLWTSTYCIFHTC